MKKLIFLDKYFPTNHSFVEDFIFEFETDANIYVSRDTVFSWAKTYRVKTNTVKVILFPRRNIWRFVNIFLVAFIITKNSAFVSNCRVFVRNCPALLLGAKLATKRIVYQRSYPHEEVASGAKKYLAYCLHKLLNTKVESIVGVSPSAEKNLRKLYRTQKFSWIPLCAKLDLFQKKKIASDEKTFVYAGTFSKERKMDIIISAFDELSHVQLHLYGCTREQFCKIYPSVEVKQNITFHGRVPRDVIIESLGKYDYCLSCVPTNDINLEMSPTKLMECVGLGLPCVATDNVSLQKHIVQKFKCGHLTSFDKPSIIEAVSHIIKANYEELNSGCYEAARAFNYANYYQTWRETFNG